jgi:hypothetical protein
LWGLVFKKLHSEDRLNMLKVRKAWLESPDILSCIHRLTLRGSVDLSKFATVCRLQPERAVIHRLDLEESEESEKIDIRDSGEAYYHRRLANVTEVYDHRDCICTPGNLGCLTRALPGLRKLEFGMEIDNRHTV